MEKYAQVKPLNEVEFKEWLKEILNFDVNEKYPFYFKTVTKQLKVDFEESDFWISVLKELNEINDKYFINKGVHLLNPANKPTVFVKSLDSLLIKAYRKNILNNINYPQPPLGGWVTPDTWFEVISDIVRTTITVKYLDGVDFIIQELTDIAAKFGHKFACSFEAREEGYYAAHAEVIIPFSIPTTSFSSIEKLIKVEIQVTTEIQEIIKTLLHTHYEKKRKITVPKDYKWQWDSKSPEFNSNYLGHIIHYVEGMIVEIRDKEK